MKTRAAVDDRRLHGLWSHPVMVASVALLILNDHVFKQVFLGQAWTGKLSDVAGMLFFPALLWSLLFLPFAPPDSPRDQRLRWLASLMTALVFAAIQVFDAAGEVYTLTLGAVQLPFRAASALVEGASLPGLVPVAHTADLSDLWALPAVLWLPLGFPARAPASHAGAVDADPQNA